MGALGEHLDTLTKPDQRALRTLLLATVRVADEPLTRLARQSILERLVDDAPIRALPEAADLHRLGGLVSRGLDGVENVPPDVASLLRALQQHSGLRQLFFVGCVSEVGRRFDDADIDWVVMKGPVLAARYYADRGDRAYGDLDLLVDRHDFPAAVRILEDLGYRHRIHNWALAEAQLAGQITMYTESVEIDLHWHLHYSEDARGAFSLEPEEMLARRRDVSLDGVTAPTFDPIDTALNLCFHAARSDGHRLVWMKDVERCLALEDLDWDEFVRRCNRYRVGPPVGLFLARSRRVLDANVPAQTISQLVSPLTRVTEYVASSAAELIQFHERNTSTRTFTRSLRSSDAATVTGLPRRSVQSLRRRLSQPAPNETDDEGEKESYFRSVVASR